MRVLVITEKIDKDDEIFSYFHGRLFDFAKECEGAIVICLEKGNFDLPPNARVLSLGKEVGASRLEYLRRFYSYIWRERRNYDKVFVHLSPIYIVLAGWFWKLDGKQIILWYNHRHVDWRLRLAAKFSDLILTGSPEGLRIRSRRARVVPGKIDLPALLGHLAGESVPLLQAA